LQRELRGTEMMVALQLATREAVDYHKSKTVRARMIVLIKDSLNRHLKEEGRIKQSAALVAIRA
jgi:hypothetical protein